MNTKILSIAVALFGECLLALIFFGLIPDDILATDVRVMDFVVCSLVFWLWALYMIVPSVPLNDPTQKKVGGLGLRMVSVGVYSLIAIIFVVTNIILACRHYEHQLSFGVQLLVHGVLLFLLLMGWLFSATATQKTAEVYHHEQALKSGKRTVKAELTEVLMLAQDLPDVPEDVRRRLADLSAQTRYITPSTSAEATRMDDRIIDGCTSIRVALPQYEMNKDRITALIDQLNRDIARRKQAY